MLITGIIAATTAAKWILVGKIMVAVGGGIVTASPVLNKIGKKKEKKR